MKTITILSALLLGAGLSFAAPTGKTDGKCKKGECKKGAAAAATAAAPGVVQVVLDDDKPAAKPERKPRGEGAKPERGPRGEGAEGRRGRGGPGGGMADRLKAKDTNKDGKITLAEFTADVPEDRAERATKFFGMLDKNSDGSITAEEMKAGMANRGGRGGERRGPPGGERGGKPGGAGGDAPARPKRPALD